MELIQINGINVLFPYKPYEIQKEYMKNVLDALQRKQNALLESPTGTGKTLSLLCSSLAWLQSLEVAQLPVLKNASEPSQTTFIDVKPLLPKIVYSSRTHAQLSQAIKELKITNYKSFPAVVLGSRDQLCLHEDVRNLKSLPAKNQLCRAKIASRSCQFYLNLEKNGDGKSFGEHPVMDIEDLVGLGRQQNICPFYAVRNIKSKASVIFTPYNYILDPTLSRNQQLELNNSVIIFDEGHNVQKSCEDIVSTELQSQTLALCIRQVNKVLQTLLEIEDKTNVGGENDVDVYKDLSIENVAILKNILCDFEELLDKTFDNLPSNRFPIETEILFEIFEKIGVGINNAKTINSTIDKISMANFSDKSIAASTSSLYSNAFKKISDLLGILIPENISSETAFKEFKSKFVKIYKLFGTKGNNLNNQEQDPWLTTKSKKNSWLLNIWCLTPSEGIKELLRHNIYNIIITSGTLAPLDIFESEMGIDFPQKLQNSHVIKQKQLNITIFDKSENDVLLTSEFKNNDKPRYYQELGKTVFQLFSSIPGGVFIFFPSYSAMEKCIESWTSENNLWQSMEKFKKIFLEPPDKISFNKLVKEFKEQIDKSSSIGAAFFGVCRGKLSEGLDLSNHYCRGVILTGLPFPSFIDPRIKFKMDYITAMNNTLTGKKWYKQQMTIALNQAIGRVIRHKDDYGVAIICDVRFNLYKEDLPKWIKDLKVINTGEYKYNLNKIRTFFNCYTTSTITKNDCVKKVTQLNQVSLENIHRKNETGKRETNFNSDKRFAITEKNILKDFGGDFKLEDNSQINLKKNIFQTLSTLTLKNKCETINRQVNKRYNSYLDDDMNEELERRENIKKKKLSNMKFRSIGDPADEDSTGQVQISEENNCVRKQENASDDKEFREFWKNYSAEIKELFGGSQKYNLLCEGLRKYKKTRDFYSLGQIINSIFKKTENDRRNKLIIALSVIIPAGERKKFLKLCRVSGASFQLQKEEFGPNSINNDSMRFILNCSLKQSHAKLVHRSLCCKSAACYSCWKNFLKANEKCFNCGKQLKLSDLKRERFNFGTRINK